MPSGHSHSSHSSSSHSSSSHSSHSSSSRSSHSHSSHSSSSSRSSHSSSSHSSRSGGFGGGPGRHGNNSHNSSSGGYRPRHNQPVEPKVRRHDVFVCRNHDYVYYAAAWEHLGKSYEAGYYDEDGKHYSGLLIKNQQTVCRCEYCGTITKIKWDGGQLPDCPNCGATFNAYTDETTVPVRFRANPVNGSATPRRAMNVGCGCLVAILVAFVIIFVGAGVVGLLWGNDGDTDDGGTTVTQESYYVEELGRYCYRVGEDYYDEITGCYFYFNTNLNPAQWQYWYEDISSDYGNYGWMEYDDTEEQWYIEVSDGKWEKLPSKYDDVVKWHFADAYHE